MTEEEAYKKFREKMEKILEGSYFGVGLNISRTVELDGHYTSDQLRQVADVIDEYVKDAKSE